GAPQSRIWSSCDPIVLPRSRKSYQSASSRIIQPPRPSRHSERRPHLDAEPSHLREGIWRGAGIWARSPSFRTSLSPFPSARFPSSSVNLTHDNVHTPQDHDRVRHCPSNTHQLRRRQVDVRRRPDMKAKRRRPTVAHEVEPPLARSIGPLTEWAIACSGVRTPIPLERSTMISFSSSRSSYSFSFLGNSLISFRAAGMNSGGTSLDTPPMRM